MCLVASISPRIKLPHMDLTGGGTLSTKCPGILMVCTLTIIQTITISGPKKSHSITFSPKEEEFLKFVPGVVTFIIL